MTPPVKKPEVKQAAPEVKPEPPKDPKPEAKVDAKADAKVETPPASSGFTLKSWSAWALPITAGYGWRDFGNDQGMDHGGFHFRAAPGLRFNLGSDERWTLSPRIFFDYQDLSKDLGQGVKSSASAWALGAEIEGGYKIHPTWFSLNAFLGLGYAHYSAPFAKDGMQGAEFNKNALLFPLDNGAVRVDLGIKPCTFNDSICLPIGYSIDSGLKPQPKVIDGTYPPVGLNPSGFNVGIMVDPIRMVEYFTSPKKKTEEKTAEPAPVAPPPGNDGAKPAPTGDGGKPAVPPTKVAPTGVALFEARVKDTETLVGKAKDSAGVAEKDAKDIKTEKDPGKAKALADDAKFSYRQALAKRDEADAYVAELKGELGKLSGDDKTKAEGLLKKAQANADEANAQARKAWSSASDATKTYNKGKSKEDQISFDDTQPEARGAKAPTGGGGTVKPPVKPPVKTDKPKDDKPKDDKPKDDKPKTDKPKEIDFGDQ